jgi:hypothetical protein
MKRNHFIGLFLFCQAQNATAKFDVCAEFGGALLWMSRVYELLHRHVRIGQAIVKLGPSSNARSTNVTLVSGHVDSARITRANRLDRQAPPFAEAFRCETVFL